MKRLQRGQTIIEAIVALMTILLIITAISIVIVNGLYNSQYIKSQNQANKYAQQGMEFVRDIQRNELVTFHDQYALSSSDFCIVGSDLTTVGCQTTGVNIPGTQFNRTISFTQNYTNCTPGAGFNNAVLVTVDVRWSTSKCPVNNPNGTFCHKSELKACLPYIYPESNP